MPRFERQEERGGAVERAVLGVLAGIASLVFLFVVGLLVAIAFLFSAKPSLADGVQYPVTVPAECVDLGRAGANAIGMGGLARVSVH